jgi:hypothetical protein
MACKLAKSPKASLCTRGFSSFVTSTNALIATGWSEPVPGRVYPAEDQRLSRRTQLPVYQSDRNLREPQGRFLWLSSLGFIQIGFFDHTGTACRCRIVSRSEAKVVKSLHADF